MKRWQEKIPSINLALINLILIFLIVLAFIISAFIGLYVKTQFVKSVLQVPFTKTVILESENGLEIGKSIFEGENLNYSLYIFIAEIMTFTILHFVLNKNKLKEYNITE